MLFTLNTFTSTVHNLCMYPAVQETGSDTSQQRSQKSDPKAVDSSKHKSKLDIGYKSRVKLTEDGLTPIHEFDEESRLTKGSMSGSPDAKVSIKSSMLRKPSQLEVGKL